jgi:hypothetical protein
METEPNQNIALLIDADNAPSAKIEFIISELATDGVVNIRRAYGNWRKQSLSGWSAILHDHAIKLSNQGPFDHRTYGFKKLSDLFAAIDLFEVRKSKSGKQVVIEVRQKLPGAPAAKKTAAKKSAKRAVKQVAAKVDS